MGAGAGGYLNIQLITHSNDATSVKGTLIRTSRLVFTPAETPTLDTRPPLKPQLPKSAGPQPPPPGTPPAGKVALGGLTNDDVTTFNLYAYADAFTAKTRQLVGMGTLADLTIAAEAKAAFGGDYWAGFAVALGPAGSRFDLVADIVLKPRWMGSASKTFQIIPVVVAFGTDSFVNHYLLSLIVAQRSGDLVDTVVTQPYR